MVRIIGENFVNFLTFVLAQDFFFTRKETQRFAPAVYRREEMKRATAAESTLALEGKEWSNSKSKKFPVPQSPPWPFAFFHLN